jgi:UDP-3-O-[3-hydroxymyristoyl] N-acetylglucosamine deacetylase / 3-hydroxyacyl-[acyl-carrier-protein] dehydratase
MSMEQQTIGSEAEFEGTGMHTGCTVRLRFSGAEPNSGVRFRRTDLPGSPEVPATLDSVSNTDHNTTLSAGDVTVATVEHVLAAVAACEVDNLVIEVDGPEVPVGDGSFGPFYDLLQRAGVRTQGEPARVLELREPVQAAGPAGASYAAVPDTAFRVATTIEFDHPLIRRQFGAWEVTASEFGAELARARTFGFLKDAEALRARGLVKGVSMDNAVILDDTGVASGDLRWADEFVRHKAGDVIGDLALIGRRIRAQVITTRPSHAGNIALARAMVQAAKSSAQGIVDITKIMQHLPHRYPMLLVDRIIDFEQGKRIVGIKNVTINEPFFQGHYPGHPIMPGVLIIEAMAQVGGLLMMDSIENVEDKVVYFMTMDNVKWRRPVTPGDQIRFELEMLQFRRNTCRMRGVGYVDGQAVAEAELMARIVDR